MRLSVAHPFRLPAAALLGALVTGVLADIKPAAAQPGPQGPPTVGVATVQRQAVTESDEYIGRVEAVNSVELRARVTGFLQADPYLEGREVKAGDVVFRIEQPPYEAQLAQARAQVASAQATLTNSEIQLNRARSLLGGPAGLQANVDNALAQQRTAQAAVLSALAQQRTAEINLGYTNVTAPVDGLVGRATYTPGNVVGPGGTDQLALLVSQDPMRVTFTVSQREAEDLRNRYAARGGPDAIRIRLRLGNGQTYNQVGRLELVDNQVSSTTDTLLLRALIPNPRQSLPGPDADPSRQAAAEGQHPTPAVPGSAAQPAAATARQLVSGQFVNVIVEGAAPVQAILIPRAAIAQDQQGNYVFVVGADNKAERRGVQLGQDMGVNTVVQSGLNPGDKVVVDGLQRVRRGQAINPVAAQPTPADQASAATGQPGANGQAQGGQAAGGQGVQGQGVQGQGVQGQSAGASPPGSAQAPVPLPGDAARNSGPAAGQRVGAGQGDRTQVPPSGTPVTPPGPQQEQ